MNTNIHSLWDQHTKLTQKIERERDKSVPDVNRLRSLQSRKKQIDAEIELVEGLVRTLSRSSSTTGPGGAPNQLAWT